MAATRRGGRRARKPQPTTTTTTTRKTGIRRGGRPARSIGTTSTQRTNALSELFSKGNELVGTMKAYGIAGIEKVQAVLGETAQHLVGASSFSGAVTVPRGTPRASTPRATTTKRATGRSVRSNNKLTAAQQQCYNAIVPNEQLNGAQIAARIGMNPTNVGRSLSGLKKKGFLQSTGRGKAAIYWKSPQQMQMTGT